MSRSTIWVCSAMFGLFSILGGALNANAATIDNKGPLGFGAGTTGGASSEAIIVTVTTPQELASALCSSTSRGTCLDNTPRIIRISGILDFRGLQGHESAEGCVSAEKNCSHEGKQEQILNGLGACTQANSKTYAVTFDAAGKTPLLVGSNKTVIGIGANSGIKGKGLKLAGGVSNIIIRNLSITDINDGVVWGGDAITIDGASKVWIDHNYIARIGRQQIVTGWGPAQSVTISGNYFDGTSDYGHYCNDRAYWILLLLGSNQTITVAGNRIHNSSGRAPKVGSSSSENGGIVHLVNNYYDGNFGAGGLNGSESVAVLVEGNYFSRGDTFHPIADNNLKKKNVNSELNFAPIGSNISSINVSCASELGRNCTANIDNGNLENGAEFLINLAIFSKIKSFGPSAIQSIESAQPVEPSTLLSRKFGPQPNIAP